VTQSADTAGGRDGRADPPITVVSGLPRTGTSLMMQMLASGGLPVLTDTARAPDPDNPRGYFEFEPTKRLATDASWMRGATGRAIKVVSALVRHLPREFTYRILFMHRSLRETLASQAAMLTHQGQPPPPNHDAALAAAFRHHLDDLQHWMAAQPHMQVLTVDYAALIQRPEEPVRQICDFLDVALDHRRMIAAIDPALYRHRG
jgi:Sulfotransferase family